MIALLNTFTHLDSDNAVVFDDEKGSGVIWLLRILVALIAARIVLSFSAESIARTVADSIQLLGPEATIELAIIAHSSALSNDRLKHLQDISRSCSVSGHRLHPLRHSIAQRLLLVRRRPPALAGRLVGVRRWQNDDVEGAKTARRQQPHIVQAGVT